VIKEREIACKYYQSLFVGSKSMIRMLSVTEVKNKKLDSAA